MLEHRQPHELSIVEAGAALRNGSLTALELTESVLSRVEATEPLLNAYITVTGDIAREQAAAADDALRDGRDLGPLHGIPIALKDLVDTAGIATTGGSGFLRDRIPDADATVYTKLKAAGATLPGKLNLHEFAFGTTSRNPHYGPVCNPWDTERIGRVGGGGIKPGRARFRHRRQHPDSGIAVRSDGIDGHLRPRLAGGRAAAVVDA